MGYLPEDQTDFLFAIVCEELGIAGAAIVIALFVILIWAGLRIVRREPQMMLKLLGLGIISIVGLQALINLAVVTGLGPTKGIALPLVSSGGTGWTLTAFALGLLVSIDRAHHEDEYVPSASVTA
jgi:cell division protein FtsW